MAEYREHDVEKVSVPPIVHDATLPDASTDADADTKTGVLVAVVGTPFDGAVARYDAALGYCVWVAVASGTPVTVDDGGGGFDFVFDEDGNVVYA